MVIGNGLLAKRFSTYRDDDKVLVFASGVSDSKLTDASAYQREQDLLEKAVRENPDKLFVYFSTCSILDNSLREQPYLIHKLKMEEWIALHNQNWLVFRLANVVGHGGNEKTVFNFLVNAIRNDQPFELWKNAFRNLIDVDDAFRLMDFFIRTGVHNSILNIANPVSHSSIEMVQAIELFCHRQARFTVVERGGAYPIDTSALQEVLPLLGIDFSGNYLLRILNKYYAGK